MINILDLYKNPNQKFVIFDIESESLNTVKQKPWQLSYLVCQGGEIRKEVDDYIYWPDLNVSEEAARVTHFDFQKYKHLARPPEEVMQRWQENSRDAIICGHNIQNFDLSILNIFYKLLNIKHDWEFAARTLDTRALALAAAKQMKNLTFPCWEDFITWQMATLTIRERGLKTSQASLLKQFGIEHDANMLHDAIYDVKMTKKILEKLLYQLKL